MPWIERDPSGFYHVAFRFQRRRFRRSLKTLCRRDAEILSARLEENLRLVERGRLTLPRNVDPGTFLISDGKLAHRGEPRPARATLHELTKGYLCSFDDDAGRPDDMALEKSMKGCESMSGTLSEFWAGGQASGRSRVSRKWRHD
jgi:hypothetical protein